MVWYVMVACYVVFLMKVERGGFQEGKDTINDAEMITPGYFLVPEVFGLFLLLAAGKK